MRFLAVLALALMSVGQASAQRFTGNTVFMAVQCEIGRFAESSDDVGLDPAMKSDGEFSWTVENTAKAEASFSISDLVKWIAGGPTVKAARRWTKTDENLIKGTFNIHERNTEACKKNVLQVPLGIRDCLMENTEVLRQGKEAACNRTRVVQGTLSADGKVVVWKIFEASAAGEYDVKATYIIKVSAPSKGEKKNEVAIAD
jgi:hypothetical protein